jgi:hypothetical protein
LKGEELERRRGNRRVRRRESMGAELRVEG